MTPFETLLHELLVAALFELTTRPRGGIGEKLAARVALAAHDDGPIGRAIRHADASLAAPKSDAHR